MKQMTKRLVRIISVVSTILILVLSMAPSLLAAQTPGLTNGAIYNIKNRNSGKYLNVNSGTDANGTNVIQWTKDGSVEQKFKLEYLSSPDSYRLRAVCSSSGGNRTLDVYRNGGLVNGCNVDIWAPNDNDAQYFKIVSLGSGYYKIVLTYNQNLALTAYGTSNGTGAGTTSTSAGNVYVSTYSGANSQQWSFEAVSGNAYANLGWSYFFHGADAKYVGGYYYFNSPSGHLGIDVLTPAGKSVYSVCSGTVRSSYTSTAQGSLEAIYITPTVSTPGDTLDLGYYHFLSGSRKVFNGNSVTTSTVIGLVGSTGNSNANHLHFEVSKTGAYSTNISDHIDPQLFFPSITFTHNGQTP